MKKLLAVIALVLALGFTARADEIAYSLTVQNAPGGIGDFSWTIDTSGFIQPLSSSTCPPDTSKLSCGSHTAFAAVSEPSTGGGCQISDVWLDPGYEPTTYFQPLCDGLYDSISAGTLPDPGHLGSWTWTGTNPDGTANSAMLTITDLTLQGADPPAVSEPGSLALLILALPFLAAFALRRKLA